MRVKYRLTYFLTFGLCILIFLSLGVRKSWVKAQATCPVNNVVEANCVYDDFIGEYSCGTITSNLTCTVVGNQCGTNVPGLYTYRSNCVFYNNGASCDYEYTTTNEGACSCDVACPTNTLTPTPTPGLITCYRCNPGGWCESYQINATSCSTDCSACSSSTPTLTPTSSPIPTPTPLASPTNFQASCVSPFGPIHLTWTNRSPPTVYDENRIIRKVGNGNWQNPWKSLPAGTIQTYDPNPNTVNITPGVKYTYQIRACILNQNGGCNATYSSPWVSTSVVCPTPTNTPTPTPTPTPIPTNTPIPTPTPPSVPSVSCSVNSGTCSCTADTTPTWNFSGGGTNLLDYKIYRSWNSTVLNCNSNPVSCNLANSTGSFTVANPKSTGNYAVQVSAVNSGGEGVRSSPVSVNIDTTAPNVDMNCSLYSIGGDSKCSFRCEVNSYADSSCSLIQEYNPSFYDSTGGSWNPGWKSYSSENPIYVYNVAPGATLYYKVKGRDGVGNASNFTAEKSVYCPAATNIQLDCNVDDGRSCACTTDSQPTWNFSTTSNTVRDFEVLRSGDFTNQTAIDCSDGSVLCNPDDTTTLKKTGSFTPANPKGTGSYTVKVRTVSDVDLSQTSVPRTANIDVTSPLIPTIKNFTCSYDGIQGGYVVNLTWSSVVDNGCAGMNAYPYWAQVSKQSNFSSVVGNWYNSWSSDTIETRVITGVTRGDKLYARVRARDAFNQQTIWSSIVSATCTGEPTPTPTPTFTLTPTNIPTPTPRPWARVKNASFQSLSTDFVITVPSNAGHYDIEDDATGPYFLIGDKAGVITVQNLSGIEGSKPMDINEAQRRLSQNRRYIDNYPILQSFSEFSDIDFFIDYIKGNKKVNKNLLPDELGRVEINREGLYLIEGSSEVIVPVDPPGADYVLVVRGNVRIQASDGEFNVGVGDVKKRNVIIIGDKIIFDSNLTKAYGVFIANTIDIPTSSNGLKIKGNLIALKSFNFSRNNLPNNIKPALFVVFDIEPYIKLFKYITISKIEYLESR